jgi:hypothetical protein
MPSDFNTAPLSNAEIEHLQDIYFTRRNIFSAVYGALSIIMLLSCFRAGVEDMGLVVGQIPIVLICIGLYRRRVRPFKKDVLKGVKELVPYTITDKKYFELTGQYFFSFDDPDYMHYEVDAMMYSQCKEGDTLYVSRAPRSKYVFDEKGRFSIM